jgi:hypothetical protein
MLVSLKLGGIFRGGVRTRQRDRPFLRPALQALHKYSALPKNHKVCRSTTNGFNARNSRLTD